MIIDFHFHLVEPLETIKSIMAKYSIEKIVGIPLPNNLEFGMCGKSDEYRFNVLKRLLNTSTEIGIKYKDDNIIFAELASATERNSPFAVVGNIIKFIPVIDHFRYNLYYFDLISAISSKPQNIVMIHTGWGSKVDRLGMVIKEFPEKTFVLAHMKEDDDEYNEDRKFMLDKFPNVYVEMSYLSSPKRLAQYVQMGFEDRILFGSDFRTMADEPTLQWMIDAVNVAQISQEQKEKILYKNAKKLLN